MISIFHGNNFNMKLESKMRFEIVKRTIEGYVIRISGPREGYVADFNISEDELHNLKKWLDSYLPPNDLDTTTET
jgi:hypothetical protein